MEEGRGNSDSFFYKEFVKRPVSKPVRSKEGSFLALSD